MSEDGNNFDNLFDLDDTPLSAEQKERMLGILKRMSHVFARDQNDLGCAQAVEHKINFTDNVPSRQPCRRTPPGQLEEFKEAVENMSLSGVVRESKSPYASPVMLVRKKDGNLRVCVDFRKINAKTIRDAYALPRISETLEALEGAYLFSTLDLQSGYLQVGRAEKDKPKTAMTTPFGLFEFNRMPFGLTNAPATFQRLMERCLTGLNLKICLAYLDDVIVFARTFEEMLEKLEAVLKRLGGHGLKLKPSKCKLFQTKLAYLGHVVSKDGVEPDPEKISEMARESTENSKGATNLSRF